MDALLRSWLTEEDSLVWLRCADPRRLRLRPVSEYLIIPALAGEEAEVAGDLKRCFGALPLELRPSPERREEAERVLYRVLHAWLRRSAKLHMGTGYVQGMGYVAGLAVVLCADEGLSGEDKALALTCAMLESVLTPTMFSRWPPLAGAIACSELAAAECAPFYRYHVPACADRLSEVLALVVPRWVLTGFISTLPTRPLLNVLTAALSLAVQDVDPFRIHLRSGTRPQMLIVHAACHLIRAAHEDVIAATNADGEIPLHEACLRGAPTISSSVRSPP
eukprot:Hpha_TRINITY_DN690_c0_g1::TRINITY_DN690_c0_g1_i2::g.21208::m.21208